VYGTPETWEGFKYIVLAEQFRDSVIDPFGDLPRKFGDLVTRTSTQFGVLAPLIPIGFIATAVRRPRYALLTGTAVAITCFFASSYVNADISRSSLGPALMVWTWLAILAAAVVDILAGLAGEAPGAADDTDAPFSWTPAVMIAAVLAVALVVPTLLDVPGRYRAVDASRQLEATTWTDHALEAMQQNAAIVSWWGFSTPLWYAQKVQGRRPDIEIIDDRTRLDQNLGSLSDVIDANLGKRPVYVIRVDTNEVRMLAGRYDLDYIDGGDARSLTRVIGIKGASAPAVSSALAN
jgi:hypothetical protein